MWKTGGATEEDYYCVVDMGLTQAAVTKLKLEHDITMSAVFDSVVANDGFVFQQLDSRRASLDLAECVTRHVPPFACQSVCGWTAGRAPTHSHGCCP